MKPAIFEEVENQLIDALADGTLEGVSTVDMHHIVYNRDNTYVYYEDAERDLKQIGTFSAIQTVMQYEQDNFGQTAPAEKYGNPCWVADMVVYILGEALIYHVFGDDEDYQNDSDITPEIAQRYAEMLDKALAEEPDLIAHLWNRL
nr:MAG TPA: hypothetical protein [Caudoviricetes sp.]